jgi:outer membrane protein TolC
MAARFSTKRNAYRSGLLLLLLLGWSAAGQAQSDFDLDLGLLLRKGSVTLSAPQVVARALRNAPYVQEALAQRRAAAERAGAAASRLWPRLDIDAAQTQLSATAVTDPRFEGFEDFSAQTTSRAQLTLPLVQTLLVDLPASAAARSDSRGAEFELQAVRADVGLNAIEALYALLRARATSLALELERNAAERHAAEAEQLSEAGRVGMTDVLSARARSAQTGLSAIDAQSKLRLARAELASILQHDVPLDVAFAADHGEVAQSIPQIALLVAQAKPARPEVRALLERMRVQADRVRAAKGTLLPELAMVAGVDLQRPRPRAYPTTDAFGVAWDVGITLHWSPTDAVTSSYQVDAGHAELEAARAALAAAERAVELEVTRAWEVLIASQASLVPARDNLTLAEQNYRAHEALFQAGRISSRELSTVAEDLRRARLSFIEIWIGTRVARARLQHARGILLSEITP